MTLAGRRRSPSLSSVLQISWTSPGTSITYLQKIKRKTARRRKTRRRKGTRRRKATRRRRTRRRNVMQ